MAKDAGGSFLYLSVFILLLLQKCVSHTYIWFDLKAYHVKGEWQKKKYMAQ